MQRWKQRVQLRDVPPQCFKVCRLAVQIKYRYAVEDAHDNGNWYYGPKHVAAGFRSGVPKIDRLYRDQRVRTVVEYFAGA